MTAAAATPWIDAANPGGGEMMEATAELAMASLTTRGLIRVSGGMFGVLGSLPSPGLLEGLELLLVSVLRLGLLGLLGLLLLPPLWKRMLIGRPWTIVPCFSCQNFMNIVLNAAHEQSTWRAFSAAEK